VVSGRARERGASLLAALLVALLIGAVVVLVGEQHQLRVRAYQLAEREILLTALVDGATAEAIAEVARDPDTSGVAEHPLGEGTVSAQSRRLDEHTVSVSVRARLGGWESVQLLEVRVSEAHPPVVTEWHRRFVRPAEA
jgi:hypothetical protein